MPSTTDKKIDELTKLMVNGFAAVADDIAEIKGDVSEIRKTMATKAELAELRSELKHDIEVVRTELQNDIGSLRSEMREGFVSVRAELKSIRMDLDALMQRVAGHAGFAKEIDHAYERIVAIEKHLGISRQIAA